MTLYGNGVSPGIAAGKIHIYRPFESMAGETLCKSGGEQAELGRYNAVKEKALAELEALRRRLEKDDPDKAKIFTAHMDIVNDVAINEEIPLRIAEEHWTGDRAIFQVYGQFIRMMKRVKDPLIAERSADFEDVRKRLLRIWHGREEEGLSALRSPVIIAAHDLLPSDTAALDRNMALAILAESGGAASHSAIIARACGIPAVLGIPKLLDSVTEGQKAAVDAAAGSVILDPDGTVEREYAAKMEALRRDREVTAAFLAVPGMTRDQVRIDLGLNLAGVTDRELEGAGYADSVGLFRTEFLYMGRETLPSEDEQFEAYRKVLERFNPRPVTLRTLDIGGDKNLTSMELPREDNPFLGNRALRFCFSRPDIFKTQLRACLRSSACGNLWLMLPMVGSLDDIREAKRYIREVKEELEREGKSPGSFKTGIMIEIPSIALIADLAAAEVDFASIGSNDLCQYACAADRMNRDVTKYYQSYHPGLFRLIGETVRAFNAAGKPIGVCGELGGDSLAAPALIGLGMRKLSMGAAALGRIKRILAGLTIPMAEETARSVLASSTADEVRRHLNKTEELCLKKNS